MKDLKEQKEGIVSQAATESLINDLRQIIEQARGHVAATANYAQTMMYWHIGERINRDVLGNKRAEFLNDGELSVQLMGRGFAWLDTGTHDSLAEASTFIEVIEKRQGLKVACLESIGYENGWLSADDIRRVAQPMIKNQYGQYLLKMISGSEME